jgi:hypothetical protein
VFLSCETDTEPVISDAVVVVMNGMSQSKNSGNRLLLSYKA